MHNTVGCNTDSSSKKNDSLGNLYTGVHNEDFSDGRILKIDPSGKIEEFYNSGSWVAGLHFDQKKTLFDTNGTILPEAGAVKEFNGHLYIGGDVIPYIGKYKLSAIEQL